MGDVDEGLLGRVQERDPPTSANSVRIWVPVSVATWPPWKALSWASRMSFRPFTPPKLLMYAKYALVPSSAPLNSPGMGEDRSSTWPTVTDLAVTPGEGPEPPEPVLPVLPATVVPDPVLPAGVEDDDVVGGEALFDEQAAKVTTETESRTTSAARGVNGGAQRPRRARIHTFSRFAFKTPPSVSPTPRCVALPRSHTQACHVALSRLPHPPVFPASSVPVSRPEGTRPRGNAF